MLRRALDVVLTSCTCVFCWNGGRDTLLQIGVEQFVGIEFLRVAGQIENLDFFRILLEPLLDDLGMMHAQIVEDKEDLLRRGSGV